MHAESGYIRTPDSIPHCELVLAQPTGEKALRKLRDFVEFLNPFANKA